MWGKKEDLKTCINFEGLANFSKVFYKFFQFQHLSNFVPSVFWFSTVETVNK